MLDLATLRESFLKSPLYLGSKKLHFSWKRKENGHVACLIDDTGKRGKVAVLTAVGVVSESQANVDGVGGWRPAFNDRLNKAKFTFMLEKPENTIFDVDWDRQIETVNRLQSGICDNSKSRYFIHSDGSGSVLRFSKPVFEKKKDGDIETVWPMEWTVPEDCQDAFDDVCKKHHIRPLTVFNEDNEVVIGDDLKAAIVGSVVEVAFTLKHYTLKDTNNEVYDCFTATVLAVTILQTGIPDDLCDYQTARDLRQTTKLEESSGYDREDTVMTMTDSFVQVPPSSQPEESNDRMEMDQATQTSGNQDKATDKASAPNAAQAATTQASGNQDKVMDKASAPNATQARDKKFPRGSRGGAPNAGTVDGFEVVQPVA